MISYTYKIKNLSVSTRIPETPDLVTHLLMLVTATDDTDNISVELTCTIHLLPSDTFIPYSELTEETVLSWIDDNSDTILRIKELAPMAIQNIRQAPVLISPSELRTPPWVPVVEQVVSETSSSNTATNIQMWQDVAFEQNLARALIKFGLLTEDPTTIPVSTP